MRIKNYVLRIVLWISMMVLGDWALGKGATACSHRDDSWLFSTLGGILTVVFVIFSMFCLIQVQKEWRTRRYFRENHFVAF